MVMTMMSQFGCDAAQALMMSIPDPSGSPRSVSSTSKACREIHSIAATALSSEAATYMPVCEAMPSQMTLRVVASSSTTTTETGCWERKAAWLAVYCAPDLAPLRVQHLNPANPVS